MLLQSFHRSVEPREWQKIALGRWRESCRGVVSAVTGAGKTTFSLLCVDHFRSLHPKARFVILVPTMALQDQWYVTLREDFGLSANDIALLGSGKKAFDGKPFVVAILNTARTLGGKLAEPTPSMLIVDECHRAGSPQNSQALLGEYSATLGLSATPERQYDTGLDDFIRPALGDVIYTYGLEDALRDKAVAPFELVNVKFDMSTEEKREYDRLSQRIARMIARGASDDDERLQSALMRRARLSWNSRLRVPLAVKLVLGARSERQIVFHEAVQQAAEIYRVLIDRGVRTTLYHAGLDPTVRRENLRLFRTGYYRVLVCCRALDEGLNVPDTSIAILASSTSSTRQRIQRLGRVLRQHPGKSKATIYTLFATDAERRRLEDEAARMDGQVELRWLQAKVQTQ